MRLSSLAVVLLALTQTSRVAAQLVVELPFDAGIPAREMHGSEVERLDLTPLQDVHASSKIRRTTNQRLGVKPLHPRANTSGTKEAPRPIAPVSSASLETVFSVLAPVASLSSASLGGVAFAPSPPSPEPLVLSSFDGTAASGGIRPGTTWVGQVTQGTGYITIGGSARDDNGWGATGLTLDATGMNSITITGQRNVGHVAGSLFLQLEDRAIGTRIFAFDSTLFAVGTPTQVQIVIGVWSSDFDFTQISGWNIGGGGVGQQDFRMTLQNVTLSASAIPEPSTCAAIMGATLLGFAFLRRRQKA